MMTGKENISIKGRVYNRLIKNASNLLDLQAVDVRVLDPIVALFLGACADEFELLYQELETYQSRILERLSGLLLPDVSKSPKPAHAVACASVPKDQFDFEELSDETAFYLRKLNQGTVSSLNSEVDVFFTPVHSVKVLDLSLRYMLVGGKLFQINGNFAKEAVAEVNLPAGMQTTCWLGLSPGKLLSSVEGLNLFFDWPTIENNIETLGLLENCRIFLNDVPLNFQKGFRMESSPGKSSTASSAFEPIFNPVEYIPDTYKSRFLSLAAQENLGSILSLTQQLPFEFQHLPELRGKTGKDNLIWLKVVFDASTPVEYMHEMVVIPNAFPVVNRRKTEFTFRIQNNLNLVPVDPDTGFFLGMDSLVSSNGSLYSSTKSSFREQKEGSYILRRGGVSRFDSREARTLLNHLIDLLRQENASYKMMGFDNVSEMLHRMEQLINSIDLKVNRNQLVRDESTYLFLHPYFPNDTLFVSYWTTNGSFGNQVRAGSVLQSFGSSYLEGSCLQLCTNTIGGKNPLSSSESLDAFKNALLTRDRVVSKSDIRHFCKALLGNLLKNLEIREIFKPSGEKNKGFEKVILVEIWLSKNPESSPDAMALMVKSQLELASGVFQKFDVRIFPPE